MGRLRLSVPNAIVYFAALACVACGGGATESLQPPPPPDFALALSSTSVSVAQGATSSGINISANSLNGFSGSVQVTLSGLPTGVTSNPASPFSISAGSSTAVTFGAASSAATGSYNVSAQGASGALSHSANLSLDVQSAGIAALPRTTYVRTDSISADDDPSGEPFHHHLSYDSANKHLFVANRAMNRVEVFSTATQTRVAQIAVPGASSVDLSPDGATIWVGTALEGIVSIDAAKLQIKNRYPLAAIVPILNTTFIQPTEVLSLSSGKAVVRLRQSASPEALLALWDPASNQLTNLTFAASQLFQSGLGPMARSGDHSKLFVAANDSSGEVALFDANANLTVGPLSLGPGIFQRVAANADATQFAAVLNANGASQLFLLNASLAQTGVYSSAAIHGIAFSRDNQFLYVSETLAGSPVLTVLNAHTAQLLGQVPDAAIQGLSSEIEDADETHLIFGLSNRGVTFVDAATPSTLPTLAPTLAAAPAAQPSEGPITGGTAIVLTGQNFGSAPQLKFGAQFATNPASSGSTQIQASSPPNATPGPVNLSAYFSNGWLALAPDAFSYGPQILQILPNAGLPAGGDTMQIYGYGFGTDPTKLTVKIATATAAIQKIENVTGIAPSLGLDASYPFSIERITVTTPPGTSGKSDISISAPSGPATAPKSFQYLQSAVSYSKPGFYRFIVYDQSRQHLYLTNIDHVDVFDLSSNTFLTALEPPGGPPPNAGLRGLSLTPDASQLVIADFGAQSIYLLNPDTATGVTVPVGGVPGFLNSGPARVAATSTQTVFVSLSGEGGSGGACSSCLAQMNLSATPPTIQPAPQPEVTSLTGSPLVQANAAGDRVFLSFSSAPGGPVAAWTAASPNQFTTSSDISTSSDLGASSDGTMFSLIANGATQIRAADLSLSAVPASPELLQIPARTFVPGVALHPSGSLIYQPFLTGAPASPGVKGGIDILDAHSGVLRLRIFLQHQFLTDIDALHGSFLTTDENGQRLFAITSSDGTPQNASVTILQLANVPLGIGTLSVTSGPAAGGAAITLRGSGFQIGTQVTFAGKSATVTFVDANTLTLITPALSPGPQQLALTNPDGETVSLDAAFTAN
jgi:IPT/TIG domain